MRSRLVVLSVHLLFGSLLIAGPSNPRHVAGPDHKARSEKTLQSHLSQLQADSNNPLLWIELGQDYMTLATSKRWDYLDKAAAYFNRYLAQFPKDPVALMLLGRVEGARALNMEPSVMTRLKWARNGFRQMDDAVKLANDSVYLRLLRAEAALMAHPILRRGSLLEEDTKMVLAFFNSPRFTSESEILKARIHLFLGNYYQKKKRMEDARLHWQATTQLSSTSTLGQEAAARLQGTFRSLGFEE